MSMARVVLYIAASLDGYIARRDGGLDWLPVPGAAEDYGYGKFIAGIDVLVMGRKTYEITRSFGAWPYAGRRTVVFSRTTPSAPMAGVEFTRRGVGEVVEELRNQSQKDIWFVGGGELVQAGFAGGLIDDIILTLVPVILGEGMPLFLRQEKTIPLRLRSSQAFSDGLVQLSYTVGRR
ncbi:MAG: dihydrofolate reductase [Opitutus sp.]|nr:dihydrofolate reductase [Opitutus sp.]